MEIIKFMAACLVVSIITIVALYSDEFCDDADDWQNLDDWRTYWCTIDCCAPDDQPGPCDDCPRISGLHG